MGFSPNVQTRQQGSQATPLANDLLSMIQGQLDQGSFGAGFGPLQQNAGTAIQQFMNSGGANIRDVGPAGADFEQMVKSLEAVQNRRVGQQASDLREQAGAAGTRYGSTLGTAEGRFRGAAQDDFNVQLGQLAMALDQARRQDTQMGINRDVAQNQLNLGAIGQMFGMGSQAINPAFQLASQGILPEHLLVSPGMGSQLLSGGMNFAGAMMPTLGQFLGNRQQPGAQMPGGLGTMPNLQQQFGQLPQFNWNWMGQ
jgi:hypothetical protein